MLEISLLTQSDAIQTTLIQLLTQNQIDYRLHTTFSPRSRLVIGDASRLKDLTRKVMMIAIMDSHQYDTILSRNGLCQFIEEEDVNQQFYFVLNRWLDYYYANYHFSISSKEDYFLDDVLFFHFPTLNKIEVHTTKQTLTYSLPTNQHFFQILPLNFIQAGPKYILNIDFIKEKGINEVTMVDGTILKDVSIKHLNDRENRFMLSHFENIHMGDFPSKEKIKKTRNILYLIYAFLIVSLSISIKNTGIPFIVGVLIVSALLALLYPIIFPSCLQVTGNYYELRMDGIYYFDNDSFKQKNKWIKAIEKDETESLLSLLPFEEFAYLRLKKRESRSMIGGRFMHLDLKNYHLRMIIETKTSTLEFADVTMFGESIKHHIEIQNTLSSFINTARIKGIDIQENEEYVFILNDPNATFSQFFNKQNKE